MKIKIVLTFIMCAHSFSVRAEIYERFLRNIFQDNTTGLSRAYRSEAISQILHRLKQGDKIPKNREQRIINRLLWLVTNPNTASANEKLNIAEILGAMEDKIPESGMNDLLAKIARKELDITLLDALIRGTALNPASSSATYLERSQEVLSRIIRFAMRENSDGRKLKALLSKLPPESQMRIIRESAETISSSSYRDTDIYDIETATGPVVLRTLKLVNSLNHRKIFDSLTTTQISSFYFKLTTLIREPLRHLSKEVPEYQQIRRQMNSLLEHDFYRTRILSSLQASQSNELRRPWAIDPTPCTSTRLDSEEGNNWAPEEARNTDQTPSALHTPLGGYGALNQGPDGYCYAFAGAVLYDSLLAGMDPFQNKDRRTSPLYAALAGAAHTMRTGSRTDGRWRRDTLDGGEMCEVLNGMIEYGACPIDKMISPSEGANLDRLVAQLRLIFDDLKGYFLENGEFIIPNNQITFCQDLVNSLHNRLGRQNSLLGQLPPLKTLTENVLKIMSRYVWQENNSNTLDHAAQVKHHFAADFIAQKCTDRDKQTDRNILSGIRCQSYKLEYASSPKHQWLRESIRRQLVSPLLPRPVGIYYCSEFFRKNSSYTNVSSRTGRILNDEDCGRHSSVIVGMREQAGKCQYLIQNSWGEGCNTYRQDLREQCERGKIWVDETNLFNNTYEVQDLIYRSH